MILPTTAFLFILTSLNARLLVAGNNAENDAGRMTIGFRSEEKTLITKEGTLIQSRNSDAAHLGKGVYIGNSPYVFEREGTENTFIITSNEAIFKSTPKVWVPKEYWIGAVDKGDMLGEREVQITEQLLEHYIADEGLDPAQSMRLAKVDGASDDIEQILIPNEMIARDQNGVPIETNNGLDFQVEKPSGPIAFGVDYDEWEGIRGSKVYTEDALRARSTFLVEKATKAVTEADKLLESDSPAVAEAIADAVATAKRCTEEIGQLYRRRPETVEFEDFNTAYKQYANARKTKAKFRKLKLTRAIEAQKSKVAEAAEKVKDVESRASGVAEAEEAAEESQRLFKTAATEAEGFKTAHEKVDSILEFLDGGEQEEFIKALVDNPRAVWAQLQESFLSMSGKELPSLDTAIRDEAAIAHQEYSIFQEGVNEAQATVTEIGKTLETLHLIVEKPDILCRRVGVDCVHIKPDDNGPKAETPAKGETPAKAETANEAELIAIAEQRSKESFDSLLHQFDYGSVVKQDQLYNELSARLPEFNTLSRSERIAGITAKVGEGALAVAGLALYGKAVADVFSSDASVLDKAAVVTSILPGIGCAVQLADGIEHGNVDAGHTALCFIEDALAVSGFWEIALVMKLSEDLSNWIKAGNEQDKLFDTEVLRSKGLAGWEANLDRMLNHLKSDEFATNTTNRFSSYQLLVLYQASQLTGDLHASHKALSGKPSNQSDEIVPHVQPELRRQICAAMAQSKFQLRQRLESVALQHTAKLAEEYKEKFLKDYWEAATKPVPIFGIPISFGSGNLGEVIEDAKKYPLPLHEGEIKRAIKEVVERLEMPAPCQCLQGSKQRPCEFADCSSPRPRRGVVDAAGRVYFTNVLSDSHGKKIGLWDDCLSLFTTCKVPGSTSETGRQIWCTPLK